MIEPTFNSKGDPIGKNCSWCAFFLPLEAYHPLDSSLCAKCETFLEAMGKIPTEEKLTRHIERVEGINPHDPAVCKCKICSLYQ